MGPETFYIQSIFFDTLRNGFIADINNNPETLGFILGAIDNGFTVKKDGCIIAKKGKIEVYLKKDRDNVEILHVVIFKGKEKQAEMRYQHKIGFMWDKTKLEKGRFYLEDVNGRYGFICSTT